MSAVSLQTIPSGSGTIIEGPAGANGILNIRTEGSEIIEACFGASTDRVLLHAENLPVEFFDLSSGVAGSVLQKLRNYRIRLDTEWRPPSLSGTRQARGGGDGPWRHGW